MKSNDIDELFPDSTEHTMYTVTVESENGEKIEQYDTDHQSVIKIIEIL